MHAYAPQQNANFIELIIDKSKIKTIKLLLCSTGFRICKILQGKIHKSLRILQVSSKRWLKSANIKSSDDFFYFG